jgi:hypothetical protein
MSFAAIVNICLENYRPTFNFVVDKHAPLRTKRVKASKSPWITSNVSKKTTCTNN